MANRKDSTIFYQSQINICKKYLTAEQFGRLMFALFEDEEGKCPEVADDIIIAFEFMSLQKKLDRKKYEEKCRKNRENGKKGGRPPKPKKANGFFQNPNDNDNENENDNENVNENDNGNEKDNYGTHHNVKLSTEEYQSLQNQFPADCDKMIDRLSRYMDKTGKTYGDHYQTICKWAKEDNIKTLDERLVEAGIFNN